MPLEDLIAKVEKRLDTLEAKPSSPKAVRELITRLDAKITEAQEKGYGISEIVDIVIECGFNLKRDEFEKQLAQTLKGKPKKTSARSTPTTRKRSDGEQRMYRKAEKAVAEPAAR